MSTTRNPTDTVYIELTVQELKTILQALQSSPMVPCNSLELRNYIEECIQSIS
jgi:hypothetical protein